MCSQRRLRWRAAPALFLWLALAAPPPALFAVAPRGSAETGGDCCCAAARACLCRLAPGGAHGCSRDGAQCLLSDAPAPDGEEEAPAAAPMLRLARLDAVSERPDPAPGRAPATATPRPPVPPAAPPDTPPPRF